MNATEAHVFQVPTVDVSAFVQDSSDSEERARVVRETRTACEEVGFIQVIGHGIPDATIEGLTMAMDWFFALPPDVKCGYIPAEPDIVGYSAPKAWSLAGSMGVAPANQMNDFFEGFNLSKSAAEFGELDLPREFYTDTMWPKDELFQTRVLSYFHEASRVAKVMMEIFVEALAPVDTDLVSLFDHSLENMRLNNYALDEGEIELDGDLTGMGEHTDFGLVTVLWADQVDGLQVLSQDGTWHDVQPDDGALLINIGDLLARMTNDSWSSTLHRVKPPIVAGRVRRRRSAAFFFEANADASIGTLEKFVDPMVAPALYESPVNVGNHIRAKFRGSAYGTSVPTVGTEADRAAAARVGMG